MSTVNKYKPNNETPTTSIIIHMVDLNGLITCSISSPLSQWNNLKVPLETIASKADVFVFAIRLNPNSATTSIF